MTGAAAIKQMSFKAAMKHKGVVAEVACGAASKGQMPILAVLFDEVTRKYWEEESGKKGDRFDVESMVGTGHGSEHEMLLKRAQVLYDTLFWKTGAPREVAQMYFMLCDVSDPIV